MPVVLGKCVTDRAAQIARDTAPSAALSGIVAHTYAATTPTPCGRASLTRSYTANRSVPRTPHRGYAM